MRQYAKKEKGFIFGPILAEAGDRAIISTAVPLSRFLGREVLSGTCDAKRDRKHCSYLTGLTQNG